MESDTELARELSFHTYVFSCAESKMKISLITNFRNYRNNRFPWLPPIYSALSIHRVGKIALPPRDEVLKV